ncbi:DUF1642 domain-containing protein [Streptococcus parasanguinis]|uniref:DUF1642 domain-containing protein n=1 Tax=Streptococcus parasanguinis TaxID=1318 RepID=UPI001896D8BB|nr:DUF1642 domain-containing protein [Streptococcus parasanguinis]MDB8620895.1 DUF1642 domain-containing protein [Streptococcus parasanguinis]
MDDSTRVVLYGTYDGFVRSTVESLQIAVRLDGGERVEIPSECAISADKIVKKDEIKLKDVIKRIKYFDLVTQAVWVNGILNELGSGFGLHKYYEGYKQGKLEGLIEREKVTITQGIADYIEYAKENDWDLQDAMDSDFIASEEDRKLSDWFYKDNNMETFALAWINGYIVKEEPKYTVKIKATKQYLSNDEIGPHFDPSFRSNFTKSDLEKLDLDWVFDCEGMEVEKVGK